MVKLLSVTREQSSEQRYGLAKSLKPILDALATNHAVEHLYICQDDLGDRARKWQFWLNRIVVRCFARFFPVTDFAAICAGTLERFNMGRLAAKIAALGSFTHVHCHDPIIAAGFRLFKAFTPGCRARWGITEHGYGCYVQAFIDEGVSLGIRVGSWLRDWERRVLLAADWVIVPTQASRVQLAQDLKVETVPAHWQVLPHPKPPLTRYSRADARRGLGWEADAIYIIGIGRLVPLKRFDRLIAAAASLPDVFLVLLGEGDRDALSGYAREVGLDERLKFAVTDDIGIYLAAADIYASFSVTESFGMANLEALVAGVPSVCSAVGGVPEVVAEGAWLIPGDDPSALIEALAQLVADPELRGRMAVSARRRGAQWPDAAAVAAAYHSIYSGIPFKPPSASPDKPTISDRFAPLHRWANGLSPCPLPQPLALTGKRIMLFAPHPDDETLGAGGTLALLRQAGAEILIVLVTDGAQGDPSGFAGGNVVSVREQEMRDALAMLGISEIVCLRQPDLGCRYSPEFVDDIARLLNAFAPDWLFFPSPCDFHRDHVASALALIEVWAARGSRERCFLYELWQPLPINWVVNISTVSVLKMEAIKCFCLPRSYFDYDAFIRGLGAYRGAYCHSSGATAEGFLEISSDDWEELVTHLLALRRWQESRLT